MPSTEQRASKLSNSLAIHKSWKRTDKWIISTAKCLEISSVFSIPSYDSTFPKYGRGCICSFVTDRILQSTLMLNTYLYHFLEYTLLTQIRKYNTKQAGLWSQVILHPSALWKMSLIYMLALRQCVINSI